MIDLQLIELPELEVVTKESGRKYQTPDNKWYPSVTTVIGWDKSKLDDWRERVGIEEAQRITKEAGRRGTAVHDMTELYIKHDFMDKKNKFYKLFMMLKYKLDNITTVVGMETPLYSDTLQLAGRVDCIGDYKGKRCIIDFKTSTRMKREEWITDYWLQCTAYSIMWYERTGEVINDLLILMVAEDGEVKEFHSERKKWMGPLQDRILEYRNVQ
jgi:genome maintenance exonuclease 1